MNEQELKSWMDEKFSSVHKRIDGLEAKVDHLGTNLAAHEKMCAEDRGGKGVWLRIYGGAIMVMTAYLVFQATGFNI